MCSKSYDLKLIINLCDAKKSAKSLQHKITTGYRISINFKDNKLILKNGQNDITGISDKE